VLIINQVSNIIWFKYIQELQLTRPQYNPCLFTSPKFGLYVKEMKIMAAEIKFVRRMTDCTHLDYR